MGVVPDYKAEIMANGCKVHVLKMLRTVRRHCKIWLSKQLVKLSSKCYVEQVQYIHSQMKNNLADL